LVQAEVNIFLSFIHFLPSEKFSLRSIAEKQVSEEFIAKVDLFWHFEFLGFLLSTVFAVLRFGLFFVFERMDGVRGHPGSGRGKLELHELFIN